MRAFQYEAGYLQGGNDVCSKKMTLEQAMQACVEASKSIGLTWSGERNPSEPIQMWVKDSNCSTEVAAGDGWHTLLLLPSLEFEYTAGYLAAGNDLKSGKMTLHEAAAAASAADSTGFTWQGEPPIGQGRIPEALRYVKSSQCPRQVSASDSWHTMLKKGPSHDSSELVFYCADSVKPPPNKKPRIGDRVEEHTKTIDWSAADPSKWSSPKVEYSGAYKFYSKPQLEEVKGLISNGLEELESHPESYDGLFYQSTMVGWPGDQQNYTFVKRTGSGFWVNPQPGGDFTWVEPKYKALPSDVSIIPDAYTNAMSYKGSKLGSTLMPGRGQGCADIPCLRVISGAHPCDVRQGSVGNCWLLGAMAAIAEYRGVIAKLFSKTSNLAERPLDAFNHYTVTLYDLSGPEWKPVDVMIDERLCTKPNERVLLGASPTLNGHLWCCYLEKAVAAHCGGWDEINGGTCVHGWRLLTGCKEVYTISSKDGGYACAGTFNPNKRVWEQLHNSPRKGFQNLWPMDWPKVGGGGSKDLKLNRDELFNRMCVWDKANYMIAAVSEEGSDDDHRDGIICGHAYTILECLSKPAGVDVQLAKMRNPWGKGEFTAGRWIDKGSGWRDHPQVKAVCNPKVADDGVFWMEQNELFEYFPAFYLCALDMSTRQ